MKTPQWKPKKIEQYKGFDIWLEFEKEDMDAKEHFIECCEWPIEDYLEIENNYWFTAKVVAKLGSIEIAASYLGGNCYANLKEVLKGMDTDKILTGYYSQLREEVYNEAIQLTGVTTRQF